jgi:hypothetical protein
LSKIDSVLLEAGECKDVVDAAGAKRSRAADISERRDDVRAAIRILRRRIVGRLVVREYRIAMSASSAREKRSLSNWMVRLSVAPVIDVPLWIG